MKKQSKIILASLLVATMATSMVGCNSNSATTSSQKEQTTSSATESKETEKVLEGNMYVTGLPILKEPETFKVVFGENASDKSEGPMSKYAIIEAEKATNVKLDWELVSGSMDERLSLLFAGGEAGMPDLILAWPGDATFSKNLSSMYEFTDDILEKYAPNIKKQYDENNAWDKVKAPDGKVHSLMVSTYSNIENYAGGVQVIRQDWLDNLGLELPKTIDEYYNVLKAFKTQDANKNGDLYDEVPLNFCQANAQNPIMSYAGPWGIAGSSNNNIDRYFKIKDGKVSTILDTQAFKDFLLFYNKLAKEQLINVEGFSMSSAQYNSMLKEKNTGTYHTWSEDMTKWTVLPPVKVEGYEPVKAGNDKLVTANTKGFIITTACKNPTALVRWWDYLHSTTDLKYEMRYGKAGTLWEKGSDGKYWALFPEEGEGKPTRGEIKLTEGMVTYCPVIWPSEAENYKAGENVRLDFNEVLKDYFPKELFPTRVVNEEKQSERNLIQTEFTEYLDSFIANSIVQGLSDAQWEVHLAKIKELGIDQWVAWYQDYLDGKF